MILDQNLSYQFDMSENWTKEVQTSPLFLNQIANFVTVNSEKTLNSHQITKIYFKLGKVAGKLRKDAESCEKMRKVAESCEKLRNCEISKSCDFRNFRNRAKFQRVWIIVAYSKVHNFVAVYNIEPQLTERDVTVGDIDVTTATDDDAQARLTAWRCCCCCVSRRW